MKRVAYLLFVVWFGWGFSVSIVKKPIQFSKVRIEKTIQYAKHHYGLEINNITMVPQMIIVHWTASNKLERGFKAMNPEILPAKRKDVHAGGDLNVSAQFLVDQDGTIYQLMPENWMGRHCIGLNHCSIGIENIGGQGGIDNLTDQQLEANLLLIRMLKKKYPSITYLIGHHEYRQFEDHPLFLEKDKGYRTDKVDPGARFMKELRLELKDLKLLSR